MSQKSITRPLSNHIHAYCQYCFCCHNDHCLSWQPLCWRGAELIANSILSASMPIDILIRLEQANVCECILGSSIRISDLDSLTFDRLKKLIHQLNIRKLLILRSFILLNIPVYKLGSRYTFEDAWIQLSDVAIIKEVEA